MKCEHNAIGWRSKLFAIEFGNVGCPTCNKRVTVGARHVTPANLVLLFGLMLSITLSMIVRSLAAYWLIVVFYFVTRALLIARAPLQDAVSSLRSNIVVFLLFALAIGLILAMF